MFLGPFERKNVLTVFFFHYDVHTVDRETLKMNNIELFFSFKDKCFIEETENVSLLFLGKAL